MPGIVGVVSSEKRESLDICIENMVLPMRRRNWYKVQRKVKLDIGIASICLDDEKTISEENSVLLAVTGEIFDLEQLRAKLLDSGDKEAFQYSLSDVLLRLYLKFSIKALCGLNGLYVISIWEDECKKLTIINDRYGFRKLYYWLSKDRLMFASEYKSIVWHPEFNKKVSELALSDFMSVGYLLDDRTLFEDIELVPPASIMTYQKGKLSFSQYWDYEFCASEGKILSKDHYVDELALRIGEAIRKRAKENMCLTVTGGVDSRALAGMLSQVEGLKVRTNTLGHEHCYDVRFGREIAQSLGYEHTFVPVGPAYVAEYSNEGVWRTEGAIACFTFWYLAQDAFLGKNGFQFVMTGDFGGSFMGGNLSVKLLEQVNEAEAVRFLYKHFYNTVFRDAELARFLRPSIHRNIEGESFNSLKRCFDAASTDNIPNRCDYVDWHQNQRRFISAHIDVLGEFSRVLDPYADTDFVDFILRVPVEMRAGKRIVKEMIVKYIPEVARIPYAKTGLPLADATRFQYMLYPYWDLFYSRILPRITSGRWGHNFRLAAHHNEGLRMGSRDFVMDILSQREYFEDYFNMDMINSMIIDHMEGRKNEFRKICVLVTFALWRKQFCQQ